MEYLRDSGMLDNIRSICKIMSESCITIEVKRIKREMFI